MSIKEVTFPLQLATKATDVNRFKYSAISVKAFYCGSNPNDECSSHAISTQVSLRDTLHYISFMPPTHGFYRLKVLVDGREHTSSPLLHILADGTLLASTFPNPFDDKSNPLDLRPYGIRNNSAEAQNPLLLELPVRLPNQTQNSSRLRRKFIEFIQQRKNKNRTSHSKRKDKSTKHSKATSNFTELVQDIPFVAEQKVAPWGMKRYQSQSLQHLSTIGKYDFKSNADKTKIQDLQKLLADTQMQAEAKLLMLCCICGIELIDDESIYLLDLYFCVSDFQRLYLNRSVREHFLVPVIQEVYLAGLQCHRKIPQVNLKSLSFSQIKKGQQYFKLIDHNNEGWIPKSQVHPLIVRLLTKMQLITNDRITTSILKGSPYIALTSGMGLERRSTIHEIEFLACIAFVVREYRDLQAFHMMKQKGQNLLESTAQFM